jgi:Cu-Zn family superoxide dismutase
MKKIIFSLCIILAFFTCKSKTDNSIIDKVDSKISGFDDNPSKYLVIDLNPKSNSRVIGKVRFVQVGENVIMTAKVSGLDEGEHAIHIHEKSDCSSDDGKSTGGHWNPTAQPHGKWGSKKGYHKGDIGNFIVENKKNTTIKFTTDQWCIGCGDKTKDILGKGLIIHKGVDDFVSQPSGAAGSRISCAGIIE